MIRLASLRRLAAGLALLAVAAVPAAAEGEAATVEGFRSAQFDMTEEQVRQAIAADFKIGAAQVAKHHNKVDRTTILSIKVPDLIPDSGIAQINYKLGYKSKKLIHVDVVWASALDPKINPQTLNALLVNLRQYLQQRGFDKDKVVVGKTTSQANIVLLFRGEDGKGRFVTLLGQFKLNPKAEKGKQLLLDHPEAVIVSYVLDAKNPDIFKIEKGKF